MGTQCLKPTTILLNSTLATGETTMSCGSIEEADKCKELGMHCATVRDGYYILGPVCVGVGLLILIWVCRTASQLQREPREAWWVVTKSNTTNTNNSKNTSATTTTLSQGAAASLRQRTKFKYFYC